jgi:hypothetical protein
MAMARRISSRVKPLLEDGFIGVLIPDSDEALEYWSDGRMNAGLLFFP